VSDVWHVLEEYQPYAERRGFGEEWRRMTRERTKSAAYDAQEAAHKAIRAIEFAEAAADMVVYNAFDWAECASDQIQSAIAAEAKPALTYDEVMKLMADDE
jgi:hypothetical protein